jgi:glucosyl-dolichyl phosphate glucuronosyltransferase
METLPPATVVISSYSVDRWSTLRASVASVLAQDPAPAEVLVVVDTPEYLELVQATFADPVRGVKNAARGINGARNTGIAEAASEVVVFLDDDAVPRPDWLSRMVAPLRDDACVGVGGSPVPNYLAPRPTWFPPEFDWIFGCRYVGLPDEQSPIEHLIGTTMAMRRDDLREVGGFQARRLEDLDISLRLAHRWPNRALIYDPLAMVDHDIPPERLTWRYFWRRCFSENRAKAAVLFEAEHATLSAERRHVVGAMPRVLWANLRALVRGDLTGAERIGASLVGLALAAAGLLFGTAEQALRHRSRHAVRDVDAEGATT